MRVLELVVLEDDMRQEIPVFYGYRPCVRQTLRDTGFHEYEVPLSRHEVSLQHLVREINARLAAVTWAGLSRPHMVLEEVFRCLLPLGEGLIVDCSDPERDAIKLVPHPANILGRHREDCETAVALNSVKRAAQRQLGARLIIAVQLSLGLCESLFFRLLRLGELPVLRLL